MESDSKLTDASRRRFLTRTASAATLLGLNGLLPAYARAMNVAAGPGRDVTMDFEIGRTEIDIAGARGAPPPSHRPVTDTAR